VKMMTLRKISSPLWISFILLFLFASPASTATASYDSEDIPIPQPGVFTPGKCAVAIPEALNDQVSCGTLTVPERHENPAGPQIQLSVMIFKGSDPNSQPDPLVIAQGGPGGSTIDTYAEVFLAGKIFTNNRDVVLFDQRGTLHTQPSLICSEYLQLVLDTIELDLSDEEIQRLDLDAASRCRQRLASQGIDLGAYNSLQNAADIQALRQALGYDQINLYGVSYGSLLAQHTLRFYPQGLRSVILDAVVPPQTNFIITAPQTGQRALDRLFAACLADEACNIAYPDLEETFYSLVDELNQNPQRAPITDPDSGETYEMVIDGDTLLSGIFQFLYIGDIIPALPHMIDDARLGKFDLFNRIYALLVFDRSTSYGMYYSVLCAEDADFDPSQVDLSGLSEQMAQAEKDGPLQFQKVCDLWQVDELRAPMDDPVTSDTPVLVLSGGFDPITPPEFGRQAAEYLANSFVFEFPTGGHSAALNGPCQDSIIQSFLDDPGQAPDASCIQPLDGFEFFTPETVIEVPALIELLNLQNNRPLEFILLLSAVAFFFLFIFIVPLEWLWGMNRQRKMGWETSPLGSYANTPSPTKNQQYTPWLLWLMSITINLFFASLVAILVFMVIGNDNRLFYGLPGAARFLLLIPILFFIFTVFYTFTIPKTIKPSGVSIGKKIIYLLALGSAILILVILFRWQMLWPWIA